MGSRVALRAGRPALLLRGNNWYEVTVPERTVGVFVGHQLINGRHWAVFRVMEDKKRRLYYAQDEAANFTRTRSRS